MPRILMQSSRSLGLWCAVVFCLTSLLTDAVGAVRSIRSANDVLSHWESTQHLYVKGNVGVGKASLDGLENWLDQHGQNWTIVLMQDARNESWTDARGVRYYGMDAVENALGRGLGNKKSFADLTDARTGQSNGAVFVLFLNERKFSYFGSEAYDHRGLGEAAWSGNLDGPARNAMRSGGRILDAVKNTITHIEGRLTQRIQYEQRLKLESKERRERLLRMTQREIIDARRELDELQDEVGKFRAQPAVRNGDLAKPPLPEWQRDLESANDALKSGHVETAASAVNTVRKHVSQHYQALQDWYHADQKIKFVGLRIDQTQLVAENRRGKQMLASIKKLYASSKADHAAGNASYSSKLTDARHALNTLDSENELALRARRNNERRERERAAKIKNAFTVGGSAAGLGLCLLGYGANRRRRKNKQHAEAVLAHWQEQMKDRVNRLFDVLDRAGVVVGSEKDLPERGYQGETLKESIHAIRAVDKAFILSSGVDDVLEQVEKLIHPSWVGSKLVNSFSRSRYEQAIELLERKPVISGQGKIKVVDRDERSLLGDRGKDVQQDSAMNTPLAFSTLIEQFDSTLDAADAALDRVDTAWETISARTGDLDLSLSKVVMSERDVRSASLSDGWLAAEQLFSTWHPSARKLHGQGIELGKHDPVAALAAPHGPIPRAETMVSEMLFCLDAMEAFRSVKLVPMLDRSKHLRRIGRRVDWINDAMALVSSDLDALSTEGARRSVQAECELFRDSLHALSDRVAYALDLAEQAKNELPDMSRTIKKSVADTRSKLSRELKLSSNAILTERDEWNPDLLLEKAAGLKQSAEASLDHGAVELAADALRSGRDALSLSDKLVKETTVAYQEYQDRSGNARSLASEAEKLNEEGLLILERLRHRYAESALYLDPASQEGETFAAAGETMRSSVRIIGVSLESSSGDFSSGKILTARNHLIEAEDHHQLVVRLHSGLEGRQRELKELDEKNAIRITDAQASLAGMRDSVKDPRVCTDTLATFAQLETIAKDTGRAVGASYGESNPYHAELALDELDARLAAMETRLTSDREAFAEAERMQVAAESSARDARRVITVSQTDGIPDSSATHDYVRGIEACDAALTECRRTLETEHSDWRDLMKEINRQHTRLGEGVAGLKNELRKARQAVESIRAARRAVNRAAMWSGRYGVRITGSPGANHVQSAHELLSQGRYEDASRTAAFARTRARQAIAAAEAREASIRRQREAEARRRRSRASSSFGSSSSFGGSSSSSGFSSSSFSSGSGFSRSGW